MFSPHLGRRYGLVANPLWDSLLEDGCLDPPVDWRETRDAHVFDVDLPGFGKDDVNLQLVPERRVLRISTERKEAEDDDGKGQKWHFRERLSPGCYSREFRLPEDAKLDEIRASMRDGVLTVVVPKDKEVHRGKKREKSKKKVVEIASADDKADHGHAKDNKRLIGRFVCCKSA